ncbi:HdeD family acid-resistance protein [Lutibacter holmesii]|uniref:HdeD family acid-resistance protein n=1 Tax=Lutibacter holmesii TaxID=1137985 RepID=A0ABW3WSZ8_9FLAO
MEQQGANLGSALIKFITFKGIILLVTGIVLLVFPRTTLATLIFVLGVYWLIDGVSTIVSSFRARKYQSSWGWSLFTGILGAVAGLVVLSKPMLSSVLTTSFLMWFLGVSAIIYGFSGLFTGLKLPKGNRKSSMIWGGIFSILFGVILISSPYLSALTIVYTIGVIAIIGGISILYVGSKMKNKLNNLN